MAGWILGLGSLARPAGTDVTALLQEIRAALNFPEGAMEEPVQMRAEGLVQGAAADVTVTFDQRGRFREAIRGKLPGQLGWDGTAGAIIDWSNTPRRITPEEMEQQLALYWIVSGYWLTQPSPVEVSHLPSADPQVLLLQLDRPESRLHATVEIDAETLQPRALDLANGPVTTRHELSDYRPHEGRLYPHRLTSRNSLGEESLWTVRAVETLAAFSFPIALTRPEDSSFDPSAPAAVECKKVSSGHLLVRPLIDAEDLGWFILDSGAGTSTISRESADAVEMESYGNITLMGVGGPEPSCFRRGTFLQLGGLIMDDPVFVEMQMEFLSEAFREHIGGVLGFAVFARAIVEIEMATGFVAFHDPESYELQGAEWESMSLIGNHPAVHCRFEGGRDALFRLDTGDGSGSVVFHQPAVERWKLLDGRKVSDSSQGGVGGSVPSKSGRIDYFEIGGHRFERPEVGFALEARGALADEGTAGNIGGLFLAPFRLVFDYGRERIAFVPRGGE